MRTDTIIVGSGISGLTAAAILSRKGQNVLVIEKNQRPGGALKQFKRRGIPFDVGFHYSGCLGQGQILSSLWNMCGTGKDINILPFPDTGSDRLYFRDTTKVIDAFFGYEKQSEELKSHFPAEKEAIDRYFAAIQSICAEIPFYNMERELTEFLRAYRTSTISAAGFIASLTTNPLLQAAFACPAILYGVPTSNVSIDVHAMVAHGYYSGASAVSGGGQAIVDSFVTRCREKGVYFSTGESVTRILADSTGVTGVFTDRGRHLGCRNVIYTGHPSFLPGMVDSSYFRPAYIKRLLTLKNSISMNIVFGVMSGNTSSLEWNNHIAMPAGPDPFDKKYSHFNDRLLMLTSTERGSYSLPQQGKSVILLQPADWQEYQDFHQTRKHARPERYREYKDSITRQMIDRVKTDYNWDVGSIEPITAGTPVTMRDELSAPEGCSYGASHSLDQYTPDIRTRLPGLYLSGQSTLMTGVAGASIAGLVAAGNILGTEQLWQELKACS